MANSPMIQGHDPLWLRGLDYLAVYEDIVWYAPLPLLGLLIAVLWIDNQVE